MKPNYYDVHRDENYLVNATISIDKLEIVNVPCKIFLPERIYEKPYVLLNLKKEEGGKIVNSHQAKLSAVVNGFDKKIELTIESPIVYFSESSTKHWGHDIVVTTALGKPQDLHIRRHRHNKDAQGTQIVFWISPNHMLKPPASISSSYTGEFSCNRLIKKEFEMKNRIRMEFDTHFSSKTLENGDFIQWPFLVACLDLDIQANDVLALKNVMLDIDDFLLIVAFATRNRTTCLGWTASDKDSYCTFYRGNFVFPEFEKKKSFHDDLIDENQFDEFVRVCYSEFLKFDNKLALRSALYSAISPPSTLEISFLKTFAGLETLILDFRRRENLEFVIPEKDWGDLRKYIQKCLKNSTMPKLEKDQRSSIYCKLNELNRVSLREAFELFCQKYLIDLSDLWPVFGKNGLVGLVDIRNKLIHGDPFPGDMHDEIFVANWHLKYTLERAICRVLQWNIDETRISSRYLESEMTVLKQWSYKQASLTNYIQSHSAY